MAKGDALGLSVRIASDRENAAIAKFMLNASTPDESPAAVEQRLGLAIAQGRIVVLDDGHGELAAAVAVTTDGVAGQVQLLSVAPAHRGKGLGTRMMAIAEALCEAMGCGRVDLSLSEAEARFAPWYARRGYGERRGNRATKNLAFAV